MLAIRDGLGEPTLEEAPEPSTAYRSGLLFAGDSGLFRFMDERPGDFLVNGRPPTGKPHPAAITTGRDARAGPGCYATRNDSAGFWAGFRGEPLPDRRLVAFSMG